MPKPFDLLFFLFLGLFVRPLVALSNQSTVQCPGYVASSASQLGSRFTALLSLAGTACNVYGTDIPSLKLEVTYESRARIHVKISDANSTVYQIPESVFARPSGSVVPDDCLIEFVPTLSPFSFKIVRRSNRETLFDSSIASLIFESQYLRLRTLLPSEPNLYGLGEHSDSFRLNTTDYIRTLWSRDAYGIPAGQNLYGNHPIYLDHRESTGTHGVFLLNSNGMDVKINKTTSGKQYLEYNVLGGIIDLYFMAGPSPVEVIQQYSEVVKKPAMMPYWGFGFHQCRYGYQDYLMVAEVIANYSRANIPLETMWTDIDYMNLRRVFSLDPDRFPLDRMQDIVHYLHSHHQQYIMMVDPAVAAVEYPPYDRGTTDDIWLKRANGSVFEGVVWPGVTVWPDWFHKNISNYWNNEFQIFFNPESGVDIDGLWIDMNEPSNFACDYPCDNPAQQAAEKGYPPTPPALRKATVSIPGFPAAFQPTAAASSKTKRASGQMKGLAGRDLLNPLYPIHNAESYGPGGLSNHTINTDVVHANGLVMYDTHNLFGTMMSYQSREAMLSRRPQKRPLVITRSTFAGAGAKVGKWLGDNLSTWEKYRVSIPSLLGMASIYHIPMVGSDVCGFGGNTTEELCARWTMLGAFSPFYRDHSESGTIFQELYQWDTVARAARKIINLRYRLLDYIYTEFQRQSTDGTPLLYPMFYIYPKDSNTFGLDMQYFYGPAVLVAPVTEMNSTEVDVYLPQDVFYDLWTFKQVKGKGEYITVTDQGITDIPLYYRGGVIIPMRVEGANTTFELRRKNFELIVPLGSSGTAYGRLYLDEGDGIEPVTTSLIDFVYEKNRLSMDGHFRYDPQVRLSKVTFLGIRQQPKRITVSQAHGSGNVALTNGSAGWDYDAKKQVWSFAINATLTSELVAQVYF